MPLRSGPTAQIGTEVGPGAAGACIAILGCRAARGVERRRRYWNGGARRGADRADDVWRDRAPMGARTRRQRHIAMTLEMRGYCEKCRAALAHDAVAYICSFECTFCGSCADALSQVCPNCG